jgi:hypothetical protein
LQAIFLRTVPPGTSLAVERKDRSHAHVHVDVGRPVEGIHVDRVFSFESVVTDFHDLFVSSVASAHLAPAAQNADEQLVGELVHPLHDFALTFTSPIEPSRSPSPARLTL